MPAVESSRTLHSWMDHASGSTFNFDSIRCHPTCNAFIPFRLLKTYRTLVGSDKFGKLEPFFLDLPYFLGPAVSKPARDVHTIVCMPPEPKTGKGGRVQK